ncbi:MAG TPA: ABC transporter ATP-binding protein [Mycobacteriales bacterium]|jgi:oligopeptide/dipeptide ABC transporter ATP-binding protein|nr:ABC transporter ATP-binding protein [Mycobacteriales bacterium]
MAERILDITGLKTHIQLASSLVRAVDGIDLHLDAGETLGLVGESGCGKSMTGLSIMGLLPPGGRVVEGSIRFEDTDLTSLSQDELRKIRGNDIAMVFQDSLTALNPTKSIGYQVAEPAWLHRGMSKKEGLDRAAEVLDLVGIPRPRERLDDFPHQLSGGLRQRVLIAMSLVCAPKVLIADEPTTALDVTIQAQILSLLDRLKEELGMAVLLITHDMGVVAGRADRINVMYAGKLIEAADTRDLFAHMHHPYTQSLLGSIPQLDQDANAVLFSIPGLPPDLADPPDGCRFAPRCHLATEQCRVEEPPLTGDNPSHSFACWHPVDGLGERPTAVRGVERARAADAAGPPLLQISELVKEFPVGNSLLPAKYRGSVKAVSGVSVTVQAGETFGLVGESGCGKTTLGRLIVALDRPNSGELLLNGEDVAKMGGRRLRRRRRDLQMMFQDPYASLDPRMRVGTILSEPLVIQGVGNRTSRRAMIASMLKEVGLPLSAVDRFPHEFSGGQRQRIGLARALMLNPAVIVADEPVSALDVSIRSQVLNLMKRLQAEHNLTYVVISHDLAVVKYLSDRIGVMYLGRLVETGSGDDIYNRAAHPYTAGLLSAIPIPDPTIDRSTDDIGVRGELPSPINPPSGCRFRTRCPRARELCAEETPQLRSFGPGHAAACHFPLIDPVPALANGAGTAPTAAG